MELRKEANRDLLTEILLRLPVKPLVRFKCVSKQWLSLISDPQFSLSHTRHHHSQYPIPTALLLKKDYSFTPDFEIVPLKQEIMPKVPFFDYLNSSGFRLRQSCNGLLLCSSYTDRNCRTLSTPRLYYICNPTTKQFKRLSFPSGEFKESLDSVYIAFDPLRSNHYKLICVHKLKRKNQHQILMYSSEKDSWSPLEITFTPPNDMQFSNAVFCNGAVHWYSKDKNSLYFDVDRECLNTMPMPNLAQRVVRYFGESLGHLHLIVTEWPYSLQFDVLEMASDYSGWVVRYLVNLDVVRITYPDIIWDREGQYKFSVLHVFRAKKEEESIVVILVDNKTISYNAHDGTSKKLYDLELPVKNDYTWCESFQYFEMLTSV